jgi:hypothetical protein
MFGMALRTYHRRTQRLSLSHGITGRAGHIADDQPVAVEQAVAQGGFADIGPAHKTNAETLTV